MQTEIIKQKSLEEQNLLLRMQSGLEEQIGCKLKALERTAVSIHTDVHDNLKNIIFDNFPSREDKLKSKIMDRLLSAVRLAARDEGYMKQLMGLLDNGAARQSEVDAANLELNGIKAEARQAVIEPSDEDIAKLIQKEDISKILSNSAGTGDIDEQLKQLTELMAQHE